MAPPERTSDWSSLLIYRPRKDEKLSWPSWLTCSGRFTHITGHSSDAGQAQDRESSPTKDRRFTTVTRHQPASYYRTSWWRTVCIDHKLAECYFKTITSNYTNCRVFSTTDTECTIFYCDVHVTRQTTSFIFLFFFFPARCIVLRASVDFLMRVE